MCGISEKEYDRQQHEQKLKTIDSKALIFNTIASNSTENLVFISDHVLRKSFIHKISKGTYDTNHGTYISYFNFDLKRYIESMTKDIFIPESQISFENIVNLLK